MQFLRSNRFTPYIVYFLAALPVFLPLLGSGFILVLDMVFAPSIPMPTEPGNTYPFYALLHILNLAIPAFVIQKMLLIGIFMCAGIGAHTLLRLLQPNTTASVRTTAHSHLWQWAAYIGGLLYMYNPFTYTRLMAGQYLVLLGYALLPFFVRRLWLFAQKPGLKQALWLAGVTTLIAVTSIHTLGIAFILVLIVVAAQVTSRSGRKELAPFLKYSLVATLVTLLLNSFWIIPVIGGSSPLGSTVGNFTITDFQAFATVPGQLSTVGNVLALQGFWGDSQNLYLLPEDVLTFWWLPLIVLWSLVLLGLVWSWRYQRKAAAIFSATGLVGLVLASGVNGSILGSINQWLATNIPLFAGYREPQKFAMLLALAYAYFAAVGLFWLWEYLRSEKQRRFVIAFSFLLPVACAPLLIWGASGQLHARNYPADWYTANHTINQEKTGSDKALFLPWHLYMPLRFSSGVTASPAGVFFDIPLISSNDPELAGAAPYLKDQDRRKVSELLPHAAENPQFGAQLRALQVQYIIVAKEFDYKNYAFLQARSDIKQILDGPTITVYKIEGGE